MLVTLHCPDCGKDTVFNEQGVCECGVGLVRLTGKKKVDIIRRTWIWREGDDLRKPGTLFEGGK